MFRVSQKGFKSGSGLQTRDNVSNACFSPEVGFQIRAAKQGQDFKKRPKILI